MLLFLFYETSKELFSIVGPGGFDLMWDNNQTFKTAFGAALNEGKL